MANKVDSLEERISKLVAENDILRQENIELKTENAQLKQALEEHESRFMKLEQNDKDTASENAKLKARVAKLEQNQSQNNEEKSNSNILRSDDAPISKSNDNIKGIDHSSVNITKMENSNDTPKQIDVQTEDVLTSDISDITSNSDIRQESSSQPETGSHKNFTPLTEIKSSEDKKIDDFLDSTYKEKVSNEIIQSIKEKKLREQELIIASQNTVPIISREQKNIQSNSQHESMGIDPYTSTLTRISSKSEQTSIDQKVTRNQMVEQGLIQELTEFIVEESIEIKKSFYLNDKKTVTVQSLVHLYQKASLAEKNTIQAKQEEILCWYYYGKDFEKMVSEILSNPWGIGAGCKNNKRANDLARGQIYDEMISHLSGITRENLRKKTQRIIKIYNLFETIGKDKIKQVRSYSATTISCLTDTNIQNIINSVSKKSHDCETNPSRTYKENLSSDFSLSPKIELDVSENKVGTPPVSKSAVKETSPETKVNRLPISQPKTLSEKQNNPAHAHANFRNKTLEQYPDIYYEFNDKNIDYYGITDGVLCPLCKLDHDEEEEVIEGKYETGSYYIKCEQREIQITV